MALTSFRVRGDWLAGFLTAITGSKTSTYIQAVTLVDSTGSPTTGSDVVIAGPLGQTTMAASVPVTLASNQSAVPISATQLPAALGQAAMAASLPVVIASNQSTITTQQAGFSFTNITTSTTTTVKSGAGVLHLVNINADGTVASAVTVYDSLTGSGTKIATINSLALSGAFVYDVAFSTGLTITTTGTQAPDITVSWR